MRAASPAQPDSPPQVVVALQLSVQKADGTDAPADVRVEASAALSRSGKLPAGAGGGKGSPPPPSAPAA
eukprot:46946-Prymnesium_polylepis.1